MAASDDEIQIIEDDLDATFPYGAPDASSSPINSDENSLLVTPKSGFNSPSASSLNLTGANTTPIVSPDEKRSRIRAGQDVDIPGNSREAKLQAKIDRLMEIGCPLYSKSSLSEADVAKILLDGPNINRDKVMDLFSQLPNEVMCEVFKHLPSSLPGKFKLAAVNQKFRANILKMMEKHRALSMNFQHQTINRIRIPQGQWPAALKVLAERTQFRGIRIGGLSKHSHLDSILNILLQTDSLDQVKFFRVGGCCSSTVLEQFLAECTNLTQLRFDMAIARLPAPNRFAIDLKSCFENKSLARLSLVLEKYPIGELIAAFKSLQPHTLEHCRLLVVRRPLDLVQLMGQVPPNVWSVLSSLKFVIHASNDAQLELLGLVARLPQLTQCSITYEGPNHHLGVPFDQFAIIVASLFNGERRENELFIHYKDPRLDATTGCAITHMVRALQQHHPQMQFNFGNKMTLDFTLDNLTFSSIAPAIASCGPHGCQDCHSFYPIVLDALINLVVDSEEGGHLHDHQLDRCKVGRIVEDFNDARPLELYLNECKALTAVANEAQDSATITLERDEGEQFYVTVDCGSCFVDSCVGCVVVI